MLPGRSMTSTPASDNDPRICPISVGWLAVAGPIPLSARTARVGGAQYSAHGGVDHWHCCSPNLLGIKGNGRKTVRIALFETKGKFAPLQHG